MILFASISSVQNFDYKLVEGLKRQEKRWDPSEHGGFAPIDRGESHRLAADAMYVFVAALLQVSTSMQVQAGEVDEGQRSREKRRTNNSETGEVAEKIQR